MEKMKSLRFAGLTTSMQAMELSRQRNDIMVKAEEVLRFMRNSMMSMARCT